MDLKTRLASRVGNCRGRNWCVFVKKILQLMSQQNHAIWISMLGSAPFGLSSIGIRLSYDELRYEPSASAFKRVTMSSDDPRRYRALDLFRPTAQEK